MLTKQNPEVKESYLTEILYLQAQKSVEALNYEMNEAFYNSDFDLAYQIGDMLNEVHKIAFNLQLQLVAF